MRFPAHVVQLINMLYVDQQATVRIDGETSRWFDIKQGIRQGCILSPYLFNLYTEHIMRNVRDAAHTKIGPLKLEVIKYQRLDMLIYLLIRQ
jgi:hypothetical protein